MTGTKDTSKAAAAAGDARADRLKAALKANLARRKSQSRKRSASAIVPDDNGQNKKG